MTYVVKNTAAKREMEYGNRIWGEKKRNGRQLAAIFCTELHGTNPKGKIKNHQGNGNLS
jgi:hypothetical protein